MSLVARPIRMSPLVLLLLTGCSAPPPAGGALPLLTRAERTRYEQTTGYGEVMQLLERAAAASDRAHLTTFGSTVEGRPLPLLVVGDVPDARPASITAPSRTRVWLQGNIHGGEVCGKEALLMLVARSMKTPTGWTVPLSCTSPVSSSMVTNTVPFRRC